MDATQPGNLAPQLPPGLRAQLRDKLGRKLAWKLNRLRCMAPAEVLHRVLRAAQARLEKAGWLGATGVPAPDLSSVSKPFVHVPEVNKKAYVEAGNRIAEGWLDVFALRNLDFGSPPRWNRDPKTGIEAPLVFGKLLDYRDPDVVGDIKYLWEPNRHLHLVTLAQAHALTGDSKYLRVITEHLESWFLACPYPMGPNWSSALEPALRLINWSITWQLTGKSIHEELRGRWLESIYQHCTYIRSWFSLHSSANNHLIGEAAALYIASVTWPHWKESNGWRETAKAILEGEALAQNGADGVNLEQAVAYQQFVFDFLLLCLLAGRANGDDFPRAYVQRLEAMLDFIASIMDAGGNVPMFGDADDGFVSRLNPKVEAAKAYKSLLATGAVLFRRGDFKRKAGALDDKTRWLLGARAETEFAALDSVKTGLPARQQFPQGGYYILGCDFDTPREVRVVADAGPLGYRSIAAHGHADALSFTLSAGGREWLVDPGTYAYHTQARWRDYFRGTGAHNTVRVDGLDQSVSGGNFMWLAKARAGCSLWLSSADRDTFEGWHDGYLRLEDPVKHRRLLQLDKRARVLVVEDTLEMEEEHDVELLFHASEHCLAEVTTEGVVLSRDADFMRITLPKNANATTELYVGSVQPIFGWVSREFDRRQPAPTIVWRARVSGKCQLRTEILLP